MLPTRPLAAADTAGLLHAVAGQATSGSTSSDRPTSAHVEDGGLPDEVLPIRRGARAAPVVKTKPTRRLEPGDLVCGECGEGNPPTRKFCSRCGEPLATAQVVKAKWYRPLLFWRRGPKRLEAGLRPGQKGAKRDRRADLTGTYRKVRGTIGLILLGLGIIYAFVPPLRYVVNDAVSGPYGRAEKKINHTWHALTDNTVPIKPVTKTANEAIRGHPGELAFDTHPNTYWAARWRPRGQKPSVVLLFEKSVTPTVAIVHPVVEGADNGKFLQVEKLRFRAGSGDYQDVSLEPDVKEQDVKLTKVSTAKKITVTVLDVVNQEGVTRLALPEIELQGKKEE